MNSYKFGDGTYKIVIYASNETEANKAWDMLQERNYYPTIGRWYVATNSINPPEKTNP